MNIIFCMFFFQSKVILFNLILFGTVIRLFNLNILQDLYLCIILYIYYFMIQMLLKLMQTNIIWRLVCISISRISSHLTWIFTKKITSHLTPSVCLVGHLQPKLSNMILNKQLFKYSHLSLATLMMIPPSTFINFSKFGLSSKSKTFLMMLLD